MSESALGALRPHKERLAFAAAGLGLGVFLTATIAGGLSKIGSPAEESTKSTAPPIALLEQPSSVDTEPSILAKIDRTDERAATSMKARAAALEAARTKAVIAQPRAPQYKTADLTVGRGDVLMEMLVDAGANRQQAYYAIESLSDIYNPRKLRVGQSVAVTFKHPVAELESESKPTPELYGLEIKTDVDQRVVVSLGPEGSYQADKVITELTNQYSRAGGTIDSSLYLAAVEAGIPDAVIVELIGMFSYDIDFQREIRKGDEFEVYYTRLYDPDGNAVKTGDIMFGSMTVQGKQKGYYRYTTPDDKIADYYDDKGQSAKKFLMRTPVNGARISSQFGRRKHPVLGYNKMHKGTDFAAPTGTPIMAAGNGVVERASRYGSYGNYVRIRHANGYQTAYAHMSKYGRGIKKGKRVKQGDIVGYVGATGRVTGAHLHYEVMLNGDKVNPLKIKVPTGRKLKGDILAQFKSEHVHLDTEMAALPDWRTVRTAKAAEAKDSSSTN